LEVYVNFVILLVHSLCLANGETVKAPTN